MECLLDGSYNFHLFLLLIVVSELWATTVLKLYEFSIWKRVIFSCLSFLMKIQIYFALISVLLKGTEISFLEVFPRQYRSEAFDSDSSQYLLYLNKHWLLARLVPELLICLIACCLASSIMQMQVKKRVCHGRQRRLQLFPSR